MNPPLIDDDRELIAVLTRALEQAGFTVSTVQDAATVLALLDTAHPDLVVLDIPLRALSALDLLAQLRERRRVAVIMLTGCGNEDERVAGLEQGADDYVSTPFSTRELVVHIGVLLQHHQPDGPAAARSTPSLVGPCTRGYAST